MRYRLEIDIDAPRERVLELFLDLDALSRWQPDLVSVEAIGDGAPRAVGAQTRQVHRMGGRTVDILETITVNDYPERFAATYEADNVWNAVDNRFADVDGRATRWTLESECRVSGIIMRVMILFVPGMFRRQTSTMMDRFKAFVEREAG